MEEALLKGLAIKVDDRYRSIDEFQRALLEKDDPPLNLTPPSLDWIALLAFSVFTAGLFTLYWTLVQAAWARRINPRHRAAFTCFSLYSGLSLIGYLLSFIPFAFMLVDPNFSQEPLSDQLVYLPFLLGAAILLLSMVFYFRGMFAMRHAIAAYYKATVGGSPKLSAALTFFCNILYIQFHLNRIAHLPANPPAAGAVAH